MSSCKATNAKVGKREEVSDELLAEVCDELSEMRRNAALLAASIRGLCGDEP